MLDVLFENGGLLVLNKPSGVSVLDDRTGAPCLLPELKAAYSRPRLVHRLDKGTSGILLVALNRHVQRDLSRAFNARAVRKHYVAVLCGHLPSGRTLTIDLPLRPGRKSRYRVAGLREEIRPTREGWTIDAEGGHASVTRVRAITRGREAHPRGRTANYRPFTPDSRPPLLDRTRGRGRSSLRGTDV